MIYGAVLLLLLYLLFSSGALGLGALGTFLADKNASRADILSEIARTMRTHNITLAEIEDALKSSAAQSETRAETKQRGGDIARTLFSWLGGIFIFAGLSVYIGMFWGSMSSGIRIFLTLGVGFILCGIFLMALRENKYPRLILPLFCAQVIMQTSGWFVAIYELFPHGNDVRKAELVVFGIMALQQAFIYYTYRLTPLAFAVIAFAYGFAQVALDLAGVSDSMIALLLGGSLILVSSRLEKTPHQTLCALGYFAAACVIHA